MGRVGDGTPWRGYCVRVPCSHLSGVHGGALSGCSPAVGTGSAAIDDQGIPKTSGKQNDALLLLLLLRGADDREKKKRLNILSEDSHKRSVLPRRVAGSERIKFREDHRCFSFAGEKEGDQRVLKGRLAKRGRALQSDIKHKTTSYSPRSRGREKNDDGWGTRASKSQNRALLRLEIGSRVGLKVEFVAMDGVCQEGCFLKLSVKKIQVPTACSLGG